jgi:hypothetical protein
MFGAMTLGSQKNIVPQPGSVQAKVLAGFLTGETEVAKLCSVTGFREKQVRGAIDALRARGWDIERAGLASFELRVARRAA